MAVKRIDAMARDQTESSVFAMRSGDPEDARVEVESRKIPCEPRTGFDGYFVGMFGFGLSTTLLGVATARGAPIDTSIFVHGIFFGGLGQVLAAHSYYMQGNVVSSFTFGFFGFWWEYLILTHILENLYPKTLGFAAGGALGTFIWFPFLFTVLVILSFYWKQNILGPLALLFVNLCTVFLGIAGSQPTWGWALTVGGIFSALAGIVATIAASLEWVNRSHGRVIFPTSF